MTVAGATGLASFSVNEAQACMECLTEKLAGKYPIGKTMIVGNEVVPAGSTAASVSSGMVPGRSDTQMDPMKFLTAFDYGKATVRADGTFERKYLIIAETRRLKSPKA